jgi:ABC-type tungstate transport system substrate-binding protein
MSPETQQPEYPYAVTIKTSTGQSADLPIAFLTREQLADFLQSGFKRLVQEAGIQGARVQVEAAIIADYSKVLGEVAACLRRGPVRAA